MMNDEVCDRRDKIGPLSLCRRLHDNKLARSSPYDKSLVNMKSMTATPTTSNNGNSRKASKGSYQYWQQCVVLSGLTFAILSVQVYVTANKGQRTVSSELGVNNRHTRELLFKNMMLDTMMAETEFRNASSVTYPFSKQQERNQCRIYLAPSSVKGLNGFGVFTTENIYRGESILQSPDGPNIPIIDYTETPPFLDGDTKRTNQTYLQRQNWINVWNNYWWGRGVSDAVLHESNTVIDYQIMFGSLPNHHCSLHAIEVKWPTKTDLPSYAFDINNPGIGAFSPYRGRDFFVYRDLKAGDEIFLSYGYCGDDIDGPDWAEYIPRNDDFDTASRITKRLNRYIRQQEATIHKKQQHVDGTASTTNIVTETVYKELLAKATANVRGQVSAMVEKLLPTTYEMFQEVVNHVPEKAWKDSNEDTTYIARALAKYIGTNVRDSDWIRSNGMCLENLIPKPSTIPQAGRGAFAQFAIAKDEMIVPASMLQILNRDVMALYDEDGEQYGSQLLENYCFGHVESSLLLCPNTNAILINHCSVRSGFNQHCSPEGPNAMYRWATSWDPATEVWMNMTIDDMLQQVGRGISMEIIATRDIQPGEEVFIDYGELWEKAWTEHHNNWVKANNDIDRNQTKRISVEELNNDDGPLKELVSGNLREIVEDETIRTMCAYYATSVDQESIYKEKNSQWKEWDDQKILDEYASDGDIYFQDYSSHRERTYWPCSVLLPEDDLGEYYTVRIYPATNHQKMKSVPWSITGVPRIITGYPRSSIRYFYHKYQSDIHLPNVFRHHIEIRNDIFPEIWKNRKNSNNNTSTSTITNTD